MSGRFEGADEGVRWGALIEPPRLDGPYLRAILDCLFRIDLLWLAEHPDTPPLYSAGVRYKREPKGRERWASIPFVLHNRSGDCEDLACYRAAELVFRGEDKGARPVYRGRKTPNGRLYHIMVLRGDGTVEDPSKKLGM